MHQEITLIILAGLVAILLLIVFFIILIVLFQKRMRKKDIEKYKAVLLAEESEQHRIGKDLHDETGALLSLAKLQLDKLDSKDKLSTEASEELVGIKQLLDKVADGIRSAAHNLVPTILTQYGLALAIAELVGPLRRSTDCTITYRHALEGRLPIFIETHLYKIIQELLANTIKHANANSIAIDLKLIANKLSLHYEDNGEGYEREQYKGIGVKNIMSRVAILGGKITIDSQLGQGTKVCVTVEVK